MSVWLREAVQPATGWMERDTPALDICFDHEGKWYGLRVLLSGPHSPWGRKPKMGALEVRAAAEALLAKSVRATKWVLANPRMDPTLGLAPTDVDEVFRDGTPAIEWTPPDGHPPIGWTNYHVAGSDNTFDARMAEAGWERQ